MKVVPSIENRIRATEACPCTKTRLEGVPGIAHQWDIDGFCSGCGLHIPENRVPHHAPPMVLVLA